MTAGRTAGSAAAGTAPQRSRRLPVLQGILPLRGKEVPANILAGITLAALGIPEVLGYAKIAGMPVVTGLYTILLPMAVFAVIGSSRHLVVGADSATAAMMAAGLATLAARGSAGYVGLAGLVALITAALLLLARLIRLGFLADFLSRTVLIGFLTGVGIQVAVGQLAEMLGIHSSGSTTVARLAGTVRGLGSAHWPTIAVSASVIVLVFGFRALTRRIPGALVAVVAAIVVSRLVHLGRHGVAVLGAVPKGVPSLQLPTLSVHAAAGLIGTAAGIFVVILAQSSATARAYAAKYDENFDENVDLIGLGLANAAAAVTGTFVVNGSPTKTEMVDSAGGRSQLAQLTTGAVVLLVLLFLTGPLAYLPLAVLATIVFLIGIELVDVRGMRRILAVRRDEFVIALLTAAAVVFIGVEQGIVLAIVASIVDHLRIGYAPRNSVLVADSEGHLTARPVSPGARTLDGLVIYRFAATLYYANAHRLLDDVRRLMTGAPPAPWFCLDCVAIGDVDFTAAAGLRRVAAQLSSKGGRLVLSEVSDRVRQELDRYGITQLLGADAYYATPAEAVHAFRRSRRPDGQGPCAGPASGGRQGSQRPSADGAAETHDGGQKRPPAPPTRPDEHQAEQSAAARREQ